MVFAEVIVPFFVWHVRLISAIATYIGGVETIILLGFLSGHGIAPFWRVFAFAYLGYFLFEMTWFFIARMKFIGRWKKEGGRFAKGYARVADTMHKLTRGNSFIALFAAKFIYGIGSMILIYLSREKLNLKKFLIYNAITLFASTYILMTIGWIAGKGTSKYINLFQNARLTISALLIVAVIFHLFRFEIKEWLANRGILKRS